jgi:hypothetical protein
MPCIYIIGIIVIGFVMFRVRSGSINTGNYVYLENTGSVLASCRPDLDISISSFLFGNLMNKKLKKVMENNWKTLISIVPYRTHLIVLGALVTDSRPSVAVTSIELGPLTVTLPFSLPLQRQLLC